MSMALSFSQSPVLVNTFICPLQDLHDATRAPTSRPRTARRSPGRIRQRQTWQDARSLPDRRGNKHPAAEGGGRRSHGAGRKRRQRGQESRGKARRGGAGRRRAKARGEGEQGRDNKEHGGGREAGRGGGARGARNGGGEARGGMAEREGAQGRRGETRELASTSSSTSPCSSSGPRVWLAAVRVPEVVVVVVVVVALVLLPNLLPPAPAPSPSPSFPSVPSAIHLSFCYRSPGLPSLPVPLRFSLPPASLPPCQASRLLLRCLCLVAPRPPCHGPSRLSPPFTPSLSVPWRFLPVRHFSPSAAPAPPPSPPPVSQPGSVHRYVAILLFVLVHQVPHRLLFTILEIPLLTPGYGPG